MSQFNESAEDTDLDAEDIEDIPFVSELSLFTFEGHQDSVYCAATNPAFPGVIITGSQIFVYLSVRSKF